MDPRRLVAFILLLLLTRYAHGLRACQIAEEHQRENQPKPLAPAPTPPPGVSSEGTRLPDFTGRTLEVLIGSASQPPMEELVAMFMADTGATVEVHFAGSGELLAKLKMTERGDIYFPGSSDYLEMAKQEGLVDPSSEVIVAYLLPAINVPRGNPKGIKTLADLAKPGIKVGIARPDTVCVGLYAVEVLEKAGLSDAVKPNIITFAESCAKTAQIVSTASVDAVLGWEVFEHWEPDRIETIWLEPSEIPRIGYLPAARTVVCKDPELTDAFLQYLVSDAGQSVFRKWHYFTSSEDARQHTRADTPVGGEWPLPDSWN